MHTHNVANLNLGLDVANNYFLIYGNKRKNNAAKCPLQLIATVLFSTLTPLLSTNDNATIPFFVRVCGQRRKKGTISLPAVSLPSQLLAFDLCSFFIAKIMMPRHALCE